MDINISPIVAIALIAVWGIARIAIVIYRSDKR